MAVAEPEAMTGRLARVRRLFAGTRPPPMRLIDRFVGPLDDALRLLFEDPSAGRMVVDRQGRLTRASARLQRMVGNALSLEPGMPARLLFAEPDRDAAWAEVAAVLRGTPGATPPPPLTAQLTHGADASLTVSVTCSPLLARGGAVEGVLLSVFDVSLQSRLEAQLAQSQRLQAAGQLAGGVAHDFNNLLTAILGGADAIAARGGFDEDMLEDIEAIRASAGRGAALVRHLLAFGRQQMFQPRVLALNDVVGDLATVLRRLLGSRVRLELVLDEPGRLVRVDAMALDQVLMNLAVNGRDAMPGGGTLTLHTGKLTLHRALPRGPETVPPGQYAMVEVQDTGFGIEADVLPHIFEPFFTTRREAGGSGLGLSTVHGIVRQSGGFLAVESAPGQGTRMRVYLPAWEGPTDAIGGEAVALAGPGAAAARGRVPVQTSLPFADQAGARGAVLLVDDEDVVRRVAERALVRQGWRVLAAPTAEAALELLQDTQAASLTAVVTDLVMPGMDGADLVQEVRQRLRRPRLPAVLVSGYAAEGLRERIAAQPGSDETRFLAKPYDIKELTAALADVLS
jgi:two-component system cell cycle sensor histidine kinase/response regulator CckA